MKAYEEVDISIHIFLTSELVGDEWSASHPARFTLEEKALGGPQSQSGRRGEEKVLDSTGTRTPTADQPVTSRYTQYAIPANIMGSSAFPVVCRCYEAPEDDQYWSKHIIWCRRDCNVYNF
jgi:hypothetical protein